MRIVEVTENKKQYLDLLLLADEQEDMVDRYLYNGKMYVLDDDGVKCECVVTDEGNGILEIKNIATVPPFQRKGYAKALIEFLVEKYRRQFSILQVGTGDSPLTIPFYEKCGFVRSHTVPNFFTDHYDHPIYECCKTLADSRLEQVVSGHFVKRQKRRRRKGLRTFRPVSARGDSNRPKVQIKPRSCVKNLRSCAFARSQARKQRPRQHR